MMAGQPVFLICIPTQVPKTSERPRHFVAAVPLLFVLWVVFVGTFAGPEMLIGAAAAIVAGVAFYVVAHAEPVPCRVRLRDVAQFLYVPWLLVQGTYEILFVSFRDLLGGRKAVSAFRVARFRAGSTDDPVDTERRVLAIAGTTMAPNFIILGINTRSNELLFHQIEKSAVPQLTKHLGADA